MLKRPIGDEFDRIAREFWRKWRETPYDKCSDVASSEMLAALLRRVAKEERAKVAAGGGEVET